MLHITLSGERMIDQAGDDLGRDRVGFSPTMSPLALYDANHGCWKLGPRSERSMLQLPTGSPRRSPHISS